MLHCLPFLSVRVIAPKLFSRRWRSHGNQPPPPNEPNRVVADSCVSVIRVFTERCIRISPGFQTLYRFRGGTDGISPNGVVLDKAGNLYGTTGAGGETSCPLNGNPGCGIVFRLNAAGRETVLDRFSGDDPDQGGPFGSVILDAAGNLCSTTSGLPLFAGTVFTVEKSGRQTGLYSFTAGANGGTPEAGLVQDAAGNLYGTTVFGGAFGQGVVFKLDTVGIESVLHNFKGVGDGTNTLASLIRDAAGNLYGTASAGGSFQGPCAGSGCGTVFMLAPNGKLKVLHTFTGGSTGQVRWGWSGMPPAISLAPPAPAVIRIAPWAGFPAAA